MPRTPDDEKEIARCFDYHSPRPDDRAKFESLTAAFKAVAEAICDVCPPGPDRDAALLQLRVARMMSNASIACDV